MAIAGTCDISQPFQFRDFLIAETGLDGQVITYDGENRPLSVRLGSSLTCYVYGADGARLKKITTANTTCPAATTTGVTLYAGMEEIRNWSNQGFSANPEQIHVTPIPAVRLAMIAGPGGTVVIDWTDIHHDALGSARGVTNSAGVKAERTIYGPFGNRDETATRAATPSPSTPFNPAHPHHLPLPPTRPAA